MRRLVLLLLLCAPAAFPYASYSGWCEQGGTKVTVAGQLSVGYIQQSYPNFTQSGAGPSVTVYATGTTNKLTLYSDAAGTPLGNPFPCTATGQYQFFSLSVVADILFSGTGISSFTRAGIGIQEPLQFVSDLNGLSIAVNCSQGVIRGATLMLSKKWDLNGTCGANIQAFSGGGFAPGLGHKTFVTGAFSGDQTQHVDLSAGGTVDFAAATVQTFYTPWFGPAGTCSGLSASRDDTAALQSAIAATGGRFLEITGKGSGACTTATGVYTYPANAGMTITSNATRPSGAYVAGAGGGIVAETGTTPAALLTNMAPQSHLVNLYLDCNSGAAVHGLVDALSINDTEENVTAQHCSGDGMQINVSGGMPGSTLTSGTIVGATSFPVGAVTNNGITFGTSCNLVVVGFGTVNQERLTYVSTGGLTLTLSAASNIHNSGEPVNCYGSANSMHISHYSGFNNSGWGMRVIPSGDNNSIFWENGSMSQNTLGGELWCGGQHTHLGGNYQGDGGPAIQLGSSVCGTQFGTWGTPGDLEESGAATNSAITASCSNEDQVGFTQSVQLIILSGCPASLPLGSSTTGIGSEEDQNGIPSMVMKTINGNIPFTPNAGARSGNCRLPGQTNYNTLGTTQQESWQICIAGAAQSVSNTTNASPAVLTVASAPATGFVYVSGYTGACAALNGPFANIHVSGTTISLTGTNSTSYGSCTGSPVVQAPAWSLTTSAPVAAINISPECLMTVAGGIGQCGDASAGHIYVPAGSGTWQVRTSAIHTHSVLLLYQEQDTGGLFPSPQTCNTNIIDTQKDVITDGNDYVIDLASAPVTNPACYGFLIVNFP